jgi:hypothetical protein
MLVQSLTTRSVHFAYLFGPPRTLGRQEASLIYDKACEHLRLDDFTFKYESAKDSETPKSQGFRIQLERKEGRGTFCVTVDNPRIQQPIRLLVQYEWPPSLEHVCERCDLAAEAVFDALEGPWQKVYAEVRLRAHCGDRGKNALAFVRERMMRVPAEWLDSLGAPLSFAACKFSTSGGASINGPPDSPARELSIEVLREDRSALYFELVSKWTQVPGAGVLPPGVDVSSLHPFTAPPSEYIRSEHEFLRERLAGLSAGLG